MTQTKQPPAIPGRFIIERTFGRIKDYRRIATRFDRNVKNYFAAIYIAATAIWWLQ